MSGTYGFNLGGLVGRGPLLRYSGESAPGRFRLGNFGERIYFPEDYSNIDHHISFLIKKFVRITRTSTLASDRPIFGIRPEQGVQRIAAITLPMPAQLSVGYNMEYADPNLTALGELVAHAASLATPQQAGAVSNELRQLAQTVTGQSAGQTISQMMQGTQNAINSILQTLQGTSSGQAGNIFGAAGAFVGGSLARNAGNQVNAVLANLTGVVANPHRVILFTGVKHRSHTFTFSLSPRNAREAKKLLRIIYLLKRAMHPKYGVGKLPEFTEEISSGLGAPEFGAGAAGGLREFGTASRAFFEYPDVFEIEMSQADKVHATPSRASLNGIGAIERRLFTIGECVMESMTVDYQPLNFPAYVKSLDNPELPLMPSQIVVTMQLRETDIVTKDQIEEYNR